eukprot:maker-scaffold_4-snap-gene-13.49-mRNA-1 protein AED:0.08 eAED:0.08 QI:26/1/1/1/1/1/3/86/772
MKAKRMISTLVKATRRKNLLGTRLFSTSQNFFHIEKSGDGVAFVTLDSKSAKVNTLGSGVFPEFVSLVSTVESDPGINAVVFLSGKKDSFIVGADIGELDGVISLEDGIELSKRGQEHISLLAKSSVHFISAINGPCLGGGLEFALACDYRIASSNSKTKLGLPEVKLGLLPGAGGTQRLPKLIGIQNALKLCTTGQNLNAVRAKRMGLVDEVADPNALKEAAHQAALRIISGKSGKKKTKFNAMKFLLEGNPLGRRVLFDQAEKMAAKQTLGNYPAIPLIIGAIKEGANNGFDKGMKAEREGFGKLLQTSESSALRSLFFGSTALKKNRFETPEFKEKYLNHKSKVGVLGAGLMGSGIAHVSAESGSKAIVKDLNLSAASRGEKQIQTILDNKVKRRRMTKHKADILMSNIEFITSDFHEPNYIDSKMASADIVVEAVLEDLTLKHKVIADLEKTIPENSIIATNTSALRLSDVCSQMSEKSQERFVGMHYFSPVDKMPLLEIIPGPRTSEETKYLALKLGLQQRKTCIVVKDVPGFFVNRCLGPYLAELTDIITNPLNGKAVDLGFLDKLMKKYGFPVGPVSLIDEVGLDVALHVQESLLEDSSGHGVGNRMSSAILLEKLVAQGNLGKKAGKGMFVYGKGKKKGPKQASAESTSVIQELSQGLPASETKDTGVVDDVELQERMAFKFINEALYCLQDGVVESPRDGDIGSVFGVGFPPFRGGPFKEVDRMGAQEFVNKMYLFRDRYGERFEPAPLVVDYAKNSKTFYKS